VEWDIDAQLLEVQRGARGGSWNFWEYYFEWVLGFIRKSGDSFTHFCYIFTKKCFKLSKFNPSPVFIHGGEGLQKQQHYHQHQQVKLFNRFSSFRGSRKGV
jgi:hypothetical protein